MDNTIVQDMHWILRRRAICHLNHHHLMSEPRDWQPCRIAAVSQHASQLETHLIHEEPWRLCRALMYCWRYAKAEDSVNWFRSSCKHNAQRCSRRLCVHSRLVMSLDCCVAALPLPVLQLIFSHLIEQQGSSVGLCRVSAVCKTWSEAVRSDPNWCGRL